MTQKMNQMNLKTRISQGRIFFVAIGTEQYVRADHKALTPHKEEAFSLPNNTETLLKINETLRQLKYKLEVAQPYDKT